MNLARTKTSRVSFDSSATWMEQAALERGSVRRAVGRLTLGAAAFVVSLGAAGATWTALRRGSDYQLDGWPAMLIAAGAAVLTSAALSQMLSFGGRRSSPLRGLTQAIERIASQPADQSFTLAATGIGPRGDLAKLVQVLNRLGESQARHRQTLRADIATKAAAISELERTIEHRATQLNTANERLLGEIAEKEDFVRAISHDLNAPLRNIGGMVTLLLSKHRTTLPEEVVHRLERIKSNVDVETDLISEMLEFSRIKTRRQSLQLVDVERVVWELRGLLENDLKTKHIDLIVETSLPNLFAERVRVRQVFQNLIDNAIKYMGADRPRREIRVGCTVRTTEAEFYVRDTGIGIAREDQDRVFVIFRRGRDETTQKVAGKGVGLASVKSIIETYAGRIWVESELGVGTTFRFTINGQYVPAVSGQIPGEMAGQATQRPPSLSSAHVAPTAADDPDARAA